MTLSEIEHRMTQAEITYNMISVNRHEKDEFYSKLPDRFTIKIGMYVSKNRRVGKRKITVGKLAMKQFKPWDKVTIKIIDNMLIVKLSENQE